MATYIRTHLNAFMFGANAILLAYEPSPFHGFMLGFFLVLVAWDFFDRATEDP